MRPALRNLLLFGGRAVITWAWDGITSLIAQAVGSNTVTYTANSTRKAIDFEGRLVLVPANAARAMGTRIVQQLLTGGASFSTQSVTTIAGTYGLSFDAASTGTITLSGTATGTLVGDGAAVKGKVFTTTAGTLTLTLSIGTGVNVLLENLTGVTNSNPSDVYVDDATSYGLGVNGLRALSTLNASTLAGSNLTRLTGAHIDSSQSAAAGGVTAGVVDATGPRGMLTEPAATNELLQSDDFSTTWVPVNATIVTNQAVAQEGTTTMDLIYPASTGAYRGVYQNVTTTPATRTQSYIVKSAGFTWATVYTIDGLAIAAWFDLTNGVVGTVLGGWTAGIKALGGGLYRIWVVGPGAGGLAAPEIGMVDADNSTTATASGTSGIYVWAGNQTLGSILSSPITTTTTAITRAAEVAQWVSAGNIASTMSGTIQVTPSTTLGTYTGYILATYVDANNWTAVWFDGTNLYASKRIGGTTHSASIAWTPTINVMAKVGWRCDAVNGVDIWLNGTKGTNNNTLTASQIGANFQVGSDGNGASQDYCEHRLLNLYANQSLSDARMGALTA